MQIIDEAKLRARERKRTYRLINNEVNIHIARAQTAYCSAEQNTKKIRFDDTHSVEDSKELDVPNDDEYNVYEVQNVDDMYHGQLDMEPQPRAIHENEIQQMLIDYETELEDKTMDEIEELKEWAGNRNIDYIALDELLVILRRRLLTSLPKTSKTFLNLNFNYDIKTFNSDGQEMSYVYFGLEGSLLNVVNPELHKDGQIFLQFNVDGMSLFKSSNTQFWPILVRICDDFDAYQPFVLGILQSEGKPHNADQYLEEFVNDINKLSETGLACGQRTFEIKIKCFVCDTPARSFLKCTKGHGGYYACERCVVQGMRKNRRTIYPDFEAAPRTDDSFRRMDSEHHTGVSPLLNIRPKVNMVTDFVLDKMHLGCNGVMLKLLFENWIKGKRALRLSNRQQKEATRRLLMLKSCIPLEFQRKPRSLKYAAKWKATELRFFLLYCGVLILQDLLKTNVYKHFLLFHVAFRILCSDDYKSKGQLAKEYLLQFFKAMRLLYGKQSLVMNVHNIIHIADDVVNMRCNLSKINAFPFENTLGKLRKFVRTPNKPLAQVCRRLQVRKNFQKQPAVIPKKFMIMKSIVKDDCVYINQLKISNLYTVTDTHPNNYIRTKSGKILKISKMYHLRSKPKKIKIVGRIFQKKRSIFTYPIKSSRLGCCEVLKSKKQLLTSANAIETKLVYLSFNRSLGKPRRSYVLPFLH